MLRKYIGSEMQPDDLDEYFIHELDGLNVGKLELHWKNGVGEVTLENGIVFYINGITMIQDNPDNIDTGTSTTTIKANENEPIDMSNVIIGK